jgi:hypothetical protein
MGQSSNHRGPPDHGTPQCPVLARFQLFSPIFTICAVAAVQGQTSPPPATPAQATGKPPPMSDIAFYLAHGDTDACGHGCKEWIAAEGKIDPGAAQRLRQLLSKLGHRKPPIFFHSPGGSLKGSIELGRLIHEQRIDVSVALTIPRDCDHDKLLDKPCDALKRSGQELEADFDPDSAMCNSACVWAFVGGTKRLVPPGVKLGIHDLGLDPQKSLPTITTTRTTRTTIRTAAGTTTSTRTATSARVASLAEIKMAGHARLLEYLHDMVIDKELLTAASAIPYESSRFLERDELVHFGIDRREFGEMARRLGPSDPPALSVLRISRGFRRAISLLWHRAGGQAVTNPMIASCRPTECFPGTREFLTAAEVGALIEAAKGNRHGHCIDGRATERFPLPRPRPALSHALLTLASPFTAQARPQPGGRVPSNGSQTSRNPRQI